MTDLEIRVAIRQLSERYEKLGLIGRNVIDNPKLCGKYTAGDLLNALKSCEIKRKAPS